VRLTTTATPADGDGDGVPNGSDSCPTAANADQTDTQGDGQADACNFTFDAASVQYTYVWKTDKRRAGKCGTFKLGLKHGSGHHALFRFTR
jgi:hypothetical protein